MNPIDPAELSALLDGELSPERAREVEAAIARNPDLRAEFEALQALDREWRSAASTAGFGPQVSLDNALGPAQQGISQHCLSVVWERWFVWAFASLAIIRVLPKLMDSLLLSTTLHAVALTVVLAGVVRMFSRMLLTHQTRAIASGLP